MSPIQLSPAAILTCIGGLLVAGIVALAMPQGGRKYAHWPLWAALLATMVVAAVDLTALLKDDAAVLTWGRGWIWQRDEVGAITVGSMQDALALVMIFLSALVSAVLLVDATVAGSGAKESPCRYFAALAVSTSGVSLAWISLTPWLAFGGIALCVFGGLLATRPASAASEANGGGRTAARLGFERSTGLALAALGGYVLASSRSALTWSGGASWESPHAGTALDTVGAALLVAGLLVQLLPFPFLGAQEGEAASPGRSQEAAAVTQVFPAWAAFALLIRLEPQLRAIGALPNMGWAGIGMALFAISSGLFQTSWEIGLGAWLSAGFSVAVSAWAFSGPAAALSILVGASLGGLSLSGVLRALRREGGTSAVGRQRAHWLKLAGVLGTAAGTGVAGFVSAGGEMRWVLHSWDQPAVSVVVTFVLFAFVLLGWKLLWSAARGVSAVEGTWVSVGSPLVLSSLALGLVWAGSATGGALPGGADRFLPSLLGSFFGAGALESAPEAAAYPSSSWLYWGAVGLGIAAAFWTSGRKQDAWARLARAFPGFTSFLASGYGVSGGFARGLAGVTWVGRSVEHLVDLQLWNRWLPRILRTVTRATAGAVDRANGRISWALEAGMRRGVEVPAKTLQLLQSGDVQWYLFFAVGSGFAILIHFLRI